MKLITEDIAKRIIKAGKNVVDGELKLPVDCVLTPAAKDVVSNARLSLRIAGSPHAAPASAPAHTKPAKPEYMTHLNKDTLVPKDNPRIRLRGEVDILIAEILKVQIRAAALGAEQLVANLEEVSAFIRELSRSEITDEPFSATTVIGLDYGEIRKVSHHPRHYFGREHLFNISYRDGELTVLLNSLRAYSRRCELAFYDAFKKADSTVLRPDLAEGYNRLSSIIYILCLRAATEQYEGEA